MTQVHRLVDVNFGGVGPRARGARSIARLRKASGGGWSSFVLRPFGISTVTWFAASMKHPRRTEQSGNEGGLP